MPAEPTELAQLLEQLLDASVEFILVGGGAAVIHGAPVTTQDIDIVHSRESGNVDRLLHVLSRLEARVVDAAGRDLKPEHAALSGTGQLLLRTRLGRVDVLGALHDGSRAEPGEPRTGSSCQSFWLWPVDAPNTRVAEGHPPAGLRYKPTCIRCNEL